MKYSRRGPAVSAITEERTRSRELLGNVGLFSICNKRDARDARWSRRSRPLEKVDGQGDPGNECFVIAEGRAKAT